MTDLLFAEERPPRLLGYDYSQAGAYFITINTKDREPLFWSNFGQIVADQWLRSAEIRKEVSLGDWVVMPDHFHGILLLSPVGAYGHTPLPGNGSVGEIGNNMSPSKTVGAMVRGFKGAVTTAINTIRQTPGKPVWQSNYYEHIIRNDAAFQRISAYIRNNPAKAGLVGPFGNTAPLGHTAPQGCEQGIELDLKLILEEQP
jgi:REP element-mobilizing transposase RayT